MFVGGNIIGPEGVTEGEIDNDGTVSFDTTAEVKTDMVGDGIYNLSDAMKTVYVREDVNSNLVFLPQQTVIVESGYNITISGTSRMVVQGNLIVEEGASINVTKGGLLYVHGNTASATIAGTITSNGASIVKSNNVALAGVTIDLTNAQSDESVIDISGTLRSVEAHLSQKGHTYVRAANLPEQFAWNSSGEAIVGFIRRQLHV